MNTLRKGHVELGTARIKQDKEDVRNTIACIDAWFPRLWEEGHPITNFATDEFATNDLKEDITDLKERREIARDKFVGRFAQDNTKFNYYDPIKRQPLKLFEKKTTKEEHSIPEDKGISFINIFAMYDEKKLICVK